MPPQTKGEFFSFPTVREPEIGDCGPRVARTEGRRKEGGWPGTLCNLVFSFIFRVININWFLSFLGLKLVKVEDHEVIGGKRKNEDLIENEMKKLKCEISREKCSEDENPREKRLKEVRSSLIQDLTSKLWNMTPVINFANPEEVEPPINSPKTVITPTRSFDSLLNLSEQESLAGDNADEREDNSEFEELKEVINYKAEASYRVKRSSSPSIEHVGIPTETTEYRTDSPGSVEVGIEIAEESLAEISGVEIKSGKENNVVEEGLEAEASVTAPVDTKEGSVDSSSLIKGKLGGGKKKKKKNSKAYKLL